MKFGVNYTPRVGWFHHWLDFDAGEVSHDFDTIVDLGADHVRIFPLWPLVQPNPTYISASALHRLDQIIELAAASGLAVSVDGLQGHLSSFDFLPSWLVTWHRRSMFTDPGAVAAAELYLETIARVAGQHPNVFAVTVGNEVNQFAGGLHPEAHHATTDDITAWLRRMLAAIRRGAPHLAALHSCDDKAWYDDSQPFNLGHVGRQGDMTLVHSWVFNGTAQRFGPDSFETTAHARYLMELARAFHVDPGRLIWLQEVGVPRNVVPQGSMEGFIRGTVTQVAKADNVFGITWWASHDVTRSLSDYPELEYDLGLIDERGKPKPEANVLKDAINQARSSTGELPVTELILDPAALDGRAALAPGGAFWSDYMTSARAGSHPRIRLVSDGSARLDLPREGHYCHA